MPKKRAEAHKIFFMIRIYIFYYATDSDDMEYLRLEMHKTFKQLGVIKDCDIN